MIVSLLNLMSERAQRAFGAAVSFIDPVHTRPAFPQGTEVIVWSEELQKWETGVVLGARGRGTYEVQAGGID